ncbi:MAG: hypothetical protein NZM37_11060 [Sandaracinaceae bacterium]|nr:hypothetical protein [Sandaracinaceae bacterium]MDW8247335.1 5'-3' exonuclease H3TH domain-containing protein [Sandaracinaceae bacterium]
MAFAFDSPRETLWRRKLEPNYKADRPPPPSHIVNGLAEIRAFAKAHSHLVLEAEGYEADDVIASVVRKAKEEGFQILIVSIDKDLFQLVDGSLVHLWDPGRRLVVGPKEVEERFGVKPSQLADWIALVGDSSDGIPGLPSIGPKRAQELLTAFGSIDGIYAALGRIDVKLRQKFQDHQELLLRYRRLTALRDDVPSGCLRGGLQKPKLAKGGA